MESLTTSPSKIISTAARKTLLPLGMFQKGRSRLWLGDQGWRLDVVEFQPSGWTKGSYLNVSCMWLWNVKRDISFDVGRVREMSLQTFEDETQFEKTAVLLTEKARESILHYRALFPSIQAVSDFYLREEPSGDGGWQCFNAAVAHGFCGRNTLARNLLSRFARGLDPSIEWQRAAVNDARHLASLLDDKNTFKELIADRVAQTRQLHTLPPIHIPSVV